MSYPHRFFIYLSAGLLALAMILYSAYWWVQADMLAARLDQANGSEIMPGVRFAFSEKAVSGFPFRFDTVLTGASFFERSPGGETSWQTEKLALHSLSYRNNRFIFEVAGEQSFTLPPAQSGGEPRVVMLTVKIGRASAILSQGRLIRFDLDLWEPNGNETSPGVAPSRSFSAARAQFHVLSRPGDTLDVAMRIEEARLGPGFTQAAEEMRLRLIDLRGTLTKGGSLQALRSGTMSLAEAAEAWRGDMGALTVNNLTLHWPDAKADLAGELVLSSAQRLTGILQGKGVQNETVPAMFGLTFADGAMRLLTASASARGAP